MDIKPGRSVPKFKECYDYSPPPILKPFDGAKSIILISDASDSVIGATLELYDDGKLYGVVAYLSRALHCHELNWPIREKGILRRYSFIAEMAPLSSKEPLPPSHRSPFLTICFLQKSKY